MKRVMKGEIAVFPINKWTCDVFTGKGWEHHSRFQLFKGHLKLVAGDPVTGEEYTQIKELLAVTQ